MGTFDRQIATATRLIAKNGRDCVWRVLNEDAPANTDEPWKHGGNVPGDHSVKIVFLPSKQGLSFFQQFTSEPLNAGADYGLMAAVDFVPTARARIYNADGTEFLRGVKAVDPLAPNGDVILYTVQFMVAQNA